MLTLASQHPALACAALLTLSNLFMTFAWYGHLKNLAGSPWWAAALISWGIALFEYHCHTQVMGDGQGVSPAKSVVYWS